MIAAGLLLALPAGFFLPGFIVVRALGLKESLVPLSFTFSHVFLFHAVFLAGITTGRVTLFSAGAALVLLTATAAMLLRCAVGARSQASACSASREREGPGAASLLAAAGAALIGPVVLLRGVLAPLQGWDTGFRWEFLARQVLSFESFSFYPPTTTADFARYFNVDGIPPLVPFSYWWLYAAAGEPIPWATGILTFAQFAAIILLAASTASRLYGRTAGLFTAGILASSYLFVRSVLIGQENGLITLSAVAAVAILTGNDEDSARAAVAAGLATSVAILSREYGWAFLVLGFALLHCRRERPRAFIAYAGVAILVAAPWYLRTLAVTGNPLFSFRFLSLPVNEVYAGLLEHHCEVLGISNWGSAGWYDLGLLLLREAALPLLVGVVAVFSLRDRWGISLGLFSALVAALFLRSIGYVCGGAWYASRALTPAVALLAVPAGGLLARMGGRRLLAPVFSGLVVVACLYSLVYTMVFPAMPVRAEIGAWLSSLVRSVPREMRRPWAALPYRLPPGTRILTDNAYLHAELSPLGYDIVPIWSPEMRFLDDDGLTIGEIRRLLDAAGIRLVWFEAGPTGDNWRQKIRFFREDFGNWVPLFVPPSGGMLLRIPSNDPLTAPRGGGSQNPEDR